MSLQLLREMPDIEVYNPASLKALAPDVRWQKSTATARRKAQVKIEFIRSAIVPRVERFGNLNAAAGDIIDKNIKFKGKVPSRATIYNLYNDYLDAGSAGLLPQHRGRVQTRHEWETTAIELYNRPGCPTFASVARVLTEVHGYKGATKDTVRRLIQNKLPAQLGTHSPARIGKKTYKLNETQHIHRTTKNILPGDIWQADGHRLDIYLAHPVTGDIFRPELIVWMDIRSRYIAGWSVTDNEGALASLEAFGSAINTHRHVPPIIYIDNGCGYKAKILTNDQTGAYTRLGVQKTIFALPGNARAKGNVERFFRTLEEGLNCFLLGYCGTTAAKESAAKFVTNAKKGTVKPMSVEQWKQQFGAWLAHYHNRPHPEVPESTPARIWGALESIDPVITQAEMNRPQVTRTVRKAIVTIENRKYTARHLVDWNRKQVIVEYDPHDEAEVTIRREDGRFICTAPLAGTADYIEKSIVDDLRKKSKIAALKRLEKKKEEIKNRANIIVTADAAAVDMERLTVKAPAVDDKTNPETNIDLGDL